MNGFLYASHCPSHKHKDNNLPLYKVGLTEKIVDIRMKSLFNTSTPEPFKCLILFKCPDERKLENLVFERYDNFRYTKRREFFFLDLEDLIKFLSEQEGYFCDSEMIDLVNKLLTFPVSKSKRFENNKNSNNEVIKNEIFYLFENGHNELMISQKMNVSLNFIAKVIKSVKDKKDIALA